MSSADLEFEQFARRILDAIEATGADYLVGGAVALWAYAEPRITRDLDVVVNLPAYLARRLSEELETYEIYLPPDVIAGVLSQWEGDLPLNAIHGASGFKADIYLLRWGDDYRANTLARRRRANLGQPIGEVWVHSPEDLILNKAHYYGLSNQEKHIRDIAAIVTFMGDALDWQYIEEWVERLGMTETWREVLRRVDAQLGFDA